MSQVIISVQYAWKEGVDASTVAAAHKKLVDECCAPIAGCRIFRYGLDEPNRRSQSYEVYDSPAAVQALLKSAMADGSPLMPCTPSARWYRAACASKARGSRSRR